MIILYIVISNSDSLKLKHFNILHTYTKYSLLFDCRCSYVALPYFRFWYLPGKATIFGRISAVTQKHFDALPCFSRDIHSTLSMKCTYFSFYPYVPCLNAKLINFYAKHHFVFVYYHETKGSAYHRKVSICIITILIENCIIKRIIMLKNISVDESKY